MAQRERDTAKPFRTLRVLAVILFILACAYGAHIAIGQVSDWVESNVSEASQNTVMTGLLALALLAYALIIAVPFVPGVEIGVALLMLRGADIAPLIYLATLGGLSLSFLAGSYVPTPWIAQIFETFRLRKAASLARNLAPLSPPRRLSVLRQKAPKRLANLTIRHRYLAVAALLNMPGNSVLGGGGGICLLVGMSGLFNRKLALMMIALAVLPVPLAVWVFGLAPWH